MSFFSAVGAINWGLKAFFGWDLVINLSHRTKIKRLDKALYGFIAFAGLVTILYLFAPFVCGI